MGIGEPLDNFDNVMKFLELVNSPEGMNISMRHISLSTCGLVPKIDELAKRKLQLTLSVSLHAPNDEIRNRIMPVNKAYPTEELLEACRRYYQATSRRISFEYAMIDGVNDREQDARELLRRLKGLPAHFNLIPLNHVEESPLKPSTRKAVAAFQKTLEDGGVTATVRRTLGGDIDASCGQLRRKYSKEQG
jgi:23S rRNA (adenine2503-C2)-methyltransferase